MYVIKNRLSILFGSTYIQPAINRRLLGMFYTDVYITERWKRID